MSAAFEFSFAFTVGRYVRAHQLNLTRPLPRFLFWFSYLFLAVCLAVAILFVVLDTCDERDRVVELVRSRVAKSKTV